MRNMLAIDGNDPHGVMVSICSSEMTEPLPSLLFKLLSYAPLCDNAWTGMEQKRLEIGS